MSIKLKNFIKQLVKIKLPKNDLMPADCIIVTGEMETMIHRGIKTTMYLLQCAGKKLICPFYFWDRARILIFVLLLSLWQENRGPKWCSCTYVCVYTCLFVHTCAYVYKCVCMCACMCICVHVCVCLSTRVWVWVCARARVHMYAEPGYCQQCLKYLDGRNFNVLFEYW